MTAANAQLRNLGRDIDDEEEATPRRRISLAPSSLSSSPTAFDSITTSISEWSTEVTAQRSPPPELIHLLRRERDRASSVPPASARPVGPSVIVSLVRLEDEDPEEQERRRLNAGHRGGTLVMPRMPPPPRLPQIVAPLSAMPERSQPLPLPQIEARNVKSGNTSEADDRTADDRLPWWIVSLIGALLTVFLFLVGCLVHRALL